MYPISAVSVLLTLLGTARVQAQTPPGSQTSTDRSLGVAYGTNGNTTVTPGILLPEALTLAKPLVYLEQQLNGTYMITLVDLSINQKSLSSSVNGTGPQVPGLEPCRTTRLHWLQTGLTQAANGTFVNNTAAVAEYGGPMPPVDDIPHTYTFYLFRQPANFTLPAWDAGRIYTSPSASTRMNFSVTAISDSVGAPVAANYIRVQNPNSTAPGTADNGTCPAGASNGTASPTPAPYTGGATMPLMQGWAAAVAVGVVCTFALM